MELDVATKKNLKEQRLNEYKQKIFIKQMDYEACKSIDDKKGMCDISEHIEALKKAYKAIEVM